VEFLAIPHNSNLSEGIMFAETDSDGRPMTADYARTRGLWEPMVEITQYKGSSETHPLLSPTDEFAGFEVRDTFFNRNPAPPSGGSYVRTALLRGLQLESVSGVNPYKFGVIGSTDSHTGLSSVEEDRFYGKSGMDVLPEQRLAGALGEMSAWIVSASGLAAAWADDNTRAAIFSAFRRREVYATSGPRISLRLFGGFSFLPSDAAEVDLAAVGYGKGVPMGGDLAHAPADRAPSLLIRAVKDPQGANLDRVQVIKGWLDGNGQVHEHIYNVAWSGDRNMTPAGSLEPVGNSVDLAQARYANTIGAAELATVWTDPDFNPVRRAFYYVRVLEIPTPRHQVYDAVALRIDPETTGQAAFIQERAWSSPIWYTP